MSTVTKLSKSQRSKRAAKYRERLRDGTISDEHRKWLEEYEATKAPPGRPRTEDQQPTPAVVDGAGGGAEQHTAPTPGVVPPSEPAPPAEPIPAPPLEAPPSVSLPRAPEQSGDWRAKYRASAHVADDGRQAVCEMVADGWIKALAAMADDLKKAEIDPLVDPAAMRGVFVLAVDEILPARVKMTPKIGAAVVTSVVIGQRYWNHKKVTEALKHDPETIEWRKRQAEREAKEMLQREQHNAEVSKAAPPVEPQPLYAAPPPPPDAPPPSINGTGQATFKRADFTAERHDQEPLV